MIPHFRKRKSLVNYSSILRGYHRTLTETLSVLGHSDPNIYPFSDLFHDYQEAIIQAVWVACMVWPGLVKETSDEACWDKF